MKALFDVEARKFNIYPLDDRGISRINPEDRRLNQTAPRPVVTYYPGAVRISEFNVPDMKNKSFSMSAEVVVGKDKANGVNAAIGGVTAGWSLYFQDNRPAFVYNFFNSISTIQGPAVNPGTHTVRFEFAYDGGGMGKGGLGTLLVDGEAMANGRIEKTVPVLFTPDETFDVGMDMGTAEIGRSFLPVGRRIGCGHPGTRLGRRSAPVRPPGHPNPRSPRVYPFTHR